MASFFYNPGLAMAMGYNSDASFPNSCWAKTNVYKVMLLKSTYVPNKDHEYVSSVSSHEVATAATYTGGYGGSGRKTLYNSDIYYDNTNDQVVMLGDLDGGWSGGLNTDAVRYAAIIFEEGGSDATSKLIMFIDLGQSYQPAGSAFDIRWAGNVIATAQSF